MKKKILVIGSLNMDQSIRLERMPLVGETVMGRGITYQAGGKGANQACAAGRLQAQVRMMGCVGADSFGRMLRDQVEGCGVDVSGIRLIEGCATGMAVIYVDGNGDNSIVVIPGANGECSREYLQQMDEWLCWCDYLLMQMEIPHETVLCAAGRAKELGKTVILNPAPVPDSLPEGLLALTDYVTPNETELEKLTGIPASGRENVRLAAEKLQEMGAENVIVTLGEDGAYWLGQQKEGFFPSRKVEAVDTTAAGDCFNGAFAAALAEGMDTEEAIRFANGAASIAVTRKGALDSLPDRREAEDAAREI